MNTLLHDLRYALRTMRRSPGFTAIAVLALALGIGANATVFSWMQAFVLRPLPLVREPGQLVVLNTRTPGGYRWSVSYPSFAEWRAEARMVDGIAAMSMLQLSLRPDGAAAAQPAWGTLVSANYFDLLGVRPHLGRTFLTSEESAPNGAPVTVLSYGLWQRSFAGDPGIVGKQVLLNNQPFTVVGVAPQSFGGTWVGLAFDLWVPVTMQPALSTGGSRLDNHAARWLEVVARLKPGVTVAQARAELDAIQQRIGEIYPEDRGTGVAVRRFDEQGTQQWLRPIFIALLGVTGLVLLIACANIANLLLARAATRRREVGIRLALGASRGRLVRQLLTESGLLALLGGAAGVLVALWARPWLGALVPPTPAPIDTGLFAGPLDGRVIIFTMAATMLAALVFGLVPALRASGGAPRASGPALHTSGQTVAYLLRGGGGARGPARSRLGGGIVVAQIALTLVALVCSGLFLRSIDALRRVDPGFRDSGHLLLVSTDLHLAGHTRESGGPLLDRLLERVRALPGVMAAAVASEVPLGFSSASSNTVAPEGYSARRDENMAVPFNVVTPAYFATMQAAIVHGREFDDGDRAGSLPVAIVNEAFAERYWPGEAAVGKRFDVGTGQMITVVGVAKTGKYEKLDEPPYPFMYFPLAQTYTSALTLHVRVAGDPSALVSTLRSSFESLDPGLPFLQPRTMTENMGAAVLPQRMGALFLSILGTIALALAVVGLYGVMSYVVSQRTRELGIRMALGATQGDVMRGVLGSGARLAALGILIGAAGALAGGRLLASQLFGISPADPLTFAAIAILLAAVALLPTFLPSGRDSREATNIPKRNEWSSHDTPHET
jgi:predicted permease